MPTVSTIKYHESPPVLRLENCSVQHFTHNRPSSLNGVGVLKIGIRHRKARSTVNVQSYSTKFNFERMCKMLVTIVGCSSTYLFH